MRLTRGAKAAAGSPAPRALTLAVTALVLLATSRGAEPPSCPPGPLAPGPAALAVSGSCGPAGAVTATVDPDTCELTLEGAGAVGLPGRGSVDGTRLYLGEGDASFDCDGAERAPGEWAVRCYRSTEAGALGCGGSELPVCDATLAVTPPP